MWKDNDTSLSCFSVVNVTLRQPCPCSRTPKQLPDALCCVFTPCGGVVAIKWVCSWRAKLGSLKQSVKRFGFFVWWGLFSWFCFRVGLNLGWQQMQVAGGVGGEGNSLSRKSFLLPTPTGKQLFCLRFESGILA